MAKGKNTVKVAEELALPVVEELGLDLWDVRFEKEGSNWYLRYFIDKENGVDIDDCVRVSRAIEKLLDEADPIEQSYTLEVCSPGMERHLIKDAHFQRYMGHPVTVRLIRPVDGGREFTGTLAGKEGDEIRLTLDGNREMAFRKSEAAYVRLFVDFDTVEDERT